ncbi:hypothetical protein ACM66B_006268 [Microbotryomycetes sp. NB124-2]
MDDSDEGDGMVARLPSHAGANRRPPQQQQQHQTHSPVVQQRLGYVGGRTGQGYSPYARRNARPSHSAVDTRAYEDDTADDDSDDSDDSDDDDSILNQTRKPRQQQQQRQGLLGAVGRALGSIFRSSSTRQLPTSTSLKDVRQQFDEIAQPQHVADQVKLKKQRLVKGRLQQQQRQQAPPQATTSALSRSSTMHNLAMSAADSGRMPSSSSTSALATLGGLHPTRSSHSTLNLTDRAYNTPAYATRHARSRQASPAPSTAASIVHNRSPSPTRNMLAGSVSAFNLSTLAQHQSPAADSSIFARQQAAPPSPAAGAFGLTSRSPFASSRSIPRSASTTGSLSGGHSLFPYASTSQRGVSPLPNSQSTSMLNTKRSYQALQMSPRPRNRVGSPLNPHAAAAARATSPSVAPSLNGFATSDVGGGDHARKKQLVWDPEKGLISRDALEKEQARTAPPPPRNEAERILEVLEGLGRTPLGEAKRGAIKPKQINVPTPSGSTLARSASTPFVSSASPYAGRPSRPTDVKPRGRGLESQLQARDERRRMLIELQRQERERERLEDEERDRERAERRRQLREEEERLRREEDEEDEDMLSAIEPEPTTRRTTRSMAREQKTPKSKTKGKAPASSAKKSTRASSKRKEAVEDPEDKGALSPPRRSTRSTKSKSPAPMPARDRSPSPSPPEPSARQQESPAAEAPPVAESKPASTSVPAQVSQRSSMRPGKSHSSRQHQSSSRVFSAREEDLPPVDESDLGKIKLPAISFPANFSFGTPAASAVKPVVPLAVPVPVPVVVKDATTKRKEMDDDDGRIVELDTKDEQPPQKVDRNASINGLFGHGPKSPNQTDKPAAFSFGAAPPKASEPAPDAPKPTFSFGQPAPATSSSNFFSKPPTTTSAAESPSAAVGSGKAPNFFGSILADKQKSPKAAPPTTSAPTFSFGSPAATTSKPESKAAAPMAAVSTAPNPFAAFGKPVAEIIKESVGQEQASGDKPALSFGSGSFSFGAKQNEAKDVTPKPAAPSFSFGKPSEPASTASPAPLSFVPPTTASDAAKRDSAAPPFSFKPTTATDAPKAAPSFSFGAKTDEKKDCKSSFAFGSASADKKDESKPSFSFGSASDNKADKPLFSVGAPSASASTVAESVDEDSGMEDTEAAPAAAAVETAATKPSGFSFSVNPPSSNASAPPFTFGAVPALKEASLKEASPAPASPFGAAPTQAPSFGGFSPSPSPAPPSPAGSTGFTFGQPAASAGQKPFTFGATPAAGASPSPFSASPAYSPNPFGASAAPTAPATTLTFGAPAASGASAFGSSSAPMAPSMSAPGFGNGAASPFGTGAQTPGGSTAPSAGFNFGAPAAAPGTTPGGSTFAFGAQSSTPFAGFGAGAPAASPAMSQSNTFGGPTTPGATTPGAGAAFNIGSGGDESPNKSGRKIAGLRRPRRA